MQRRAITVTGIVQGVGFRPFVHSLASRYRLVGFVQNRSGEVQIEVEGAAAKLDQFIEQLQSHAPALSRINQLSWLPVPICGDACFRIVDSEQGLASQVFVSPDVAMCEDCRRELFDPADRRFRYPFLNCTQCGPRLTITDRAPYDRVNTTMAAFEMCAACRAEYENPRDRRFHAQPIACPDCGPRLQLLDENAKPITAEDPLTRFVAGLMQGKIGALKGIGGYHLVCLAKDDDVVTRLRKRKHRDQKPFAVMVGNSTLAARWCVINDAERELLQSPRRPIVCLRKRNRVPGISDTVAPTNASLGMMLPYSPLHALLMDCIGDQPLVMTSGNRRDEPMAYQDADAIERLCGIADCFLTHNRAICVRCDDSVTRVISGRESPLRRSRGDAPMPIKLPFVCPQPILAVGGQLKNVFALASGDQAFLSHHIGDLDHLAAYESFGRDIALYERLLEIQPDVVVHDLHPDYASTTYAVERAEQDSSCVFGVQHHHAHLASCMVEHGIAGDVIGVIFDGSGYGSDETIWGGEFLVGGYPSFKRAAQLRPVRLPGGDKATKEPWRVALSYFMQADCDCEAWQREVNAAIRPSAVRPSAVRIVQQMIDRGFNSPWTSSAGRLFDAVAAIAGIRQTAHFEGQAAIELEAIALQVDGDETYPIEPLQQTAEWTSSCQVVDTRPLIRSVVADGANKIDKAIIARRFHNTLAAMTVQTCIQIANSTSINRIVLSGGAFTNTLLSSLVVAQLQSKGLSVFVHQRVPANDGGLCLGQLAIAAHSLHRDYHSKTAC
ncbi:(NiFe) hydrogenase maturation protein HypF [Rhodopirellula maiorica SM1]|uniref:Carbamoyltransferase n=1 Tax=Rhodopirellula maiorica SM1 TaxID=1265738 RepID=M5RJ72_9BACT|nr:carbamoyltransferase HypF [Rhodopirellula maiorica]EMI19358.1 (NiFe) hydrogenase maturation protein HypF [Rhodopirellula maiorica SM1]